jgi:hypothetical protein
VLMYITDLWGEKLVVMAIMFWARQSIVFFFFIFLQK